MREGPVARDVPFDILVNNAGLAGAHGTTKDGFELTFGTNHLGPYLFTRLLVPALERAATSRLRRERRGRRADGPLLRQVPAEGREQARPRRRAGARAVGSQRRVGRIASLRTAGSTLRPRHLTVDVQVR